MKLDLIDAFTTSLPFSGNPAAVIQSSQPLSDDLMQQIVAPVEYDDAIEGSAALP